MRLNAQQIQTMIHEQPELRRELEKYYRRGYSQGAASGTYAAAIGATPLQLERWRRRVYQWRCDLPAEHDAPDWTKWTRPEHLADTMTMPKGGSI